MDQTMILISSQKSQKKRREVEFDSAGEDTRKHKVFSLPITKKVNRIDKSGEEIKKIIHYKFQFIDSTGKVFNLVDNIAEGIHKIKGKHEYANK